MKKSELRQIIREEIQKLSKKRTLTEGVREDLHAQREFMRDFETSRTRMRYPEDINEAKYWLSPVGKTDDFNDKISDEIIDGKTRQGPWALMTPNSFKKYGTGKLGTGSGQKYKKQSDGKWLKIEG